MTDNQIILDKIKEILAYHKEDQLLTSESQKGERLRFFSKSGKSPKLAAEQLGERARKFLDEHKEKYESGEIAPPYTQQKINDIYNLFAELDKDMKGDPNGTPQEKLSAQKWEEMWEEIKRNYKDEHGIDLTEEQLKEAQTSIATAYRFKTISTMEKALKGSYSDQTANFRGQDFIQTVNKHYSTLTPDQAKDKIFKTLEEKSKEDVNRDLQVLEGLINEGKYEEYKKEFETAINRKEIEYLGTRDQITNPCKEMLTNKMVSVMQSSKPNQAEVSQLVKLGANPDLNVKTTNYKRSLFQKFKDAVQGNLFQNIKDAWQEKSLAPLTNTPPRNLLEIAQISGDKELVGTLKSLQSLSQPAKEKDSTVAQVSELQQWAENQRAPETVNFLRVSQELVKKLYSEYDPAELKEEVDKLMNEYIVEGAISSVNIDNDEVVNKIKEAVKDPNFLEDKEKTATFIKELNQARSIIHGLVGANGGGRTENSAKELEGLKPQEIGEPKPKNSSNSPDLPPDVLQKIQGIKESESAQQLSTQNSVIPFPGPPYTPNRDTLSTVSPIIKADFTKGWTTVLEGRIQEIKNNSEFKGSEVTFNKRQFECEVKELTKIVDYLKSGSPSEIGLESKIKDALDTSKKFAEKYGPGNEGIREPTKLLLRELREGDAAPKAKQEGKEQRKSKLNN